MKIFSFAFLALALGAALFVPAPVAKKTAEVVAVAAGDPPPLCRDFPFCDDK